MAMKIIVLLVLLAGHVCLATNRKMMHTNWEDTIAVAPQPATAANYTVAVSTVAAAAPAPAPDDEEMKNHHSIPRRSWDSSRDQDENGTSDDNSG